MKHRIPCITVSAALMTVTETVWINTPFMLTTICFTRAYHFCKVVYSITLCVRVCACDLCRSVTWLQDSLCKFFIRQSFQSCTRQHFACNNVWSLRKKEEIDSGRRRKWIWKEEDGEEKEKEKKKGKKEANVAVEGEQEEEEKSSRNNEDSAKLCSSKGQECACFL